MIGLIRNNFYSMESNLMISLILAAALGFSPLIISDGACCRTLTLACP